MSTVSRPDSPQFQLLRYPAMSSTSFLVIGDGASVFRTPCTKIYKYIMIIIFLILKIILLLIKRGIGWVFSLYFLVECVTKVTRGKQGKNLKISFENMVQMFFVAVLVVAMHCTQLWMENFWRLRQDFMRGPYWTSIHWRHYFIHLEIISKGWIRKTRNLGLRPKSYQCKPYCS